MTFEYHLNKLFRPKAATCLESGIRGYVKVRAGYAPIVKVNGLWTVEVGGREYRSSLLGDLVAQLNDEGHTFINRRTMEALR